MIDEKVIEDLKQERNYSIQKHGEFNRFSTLEKSLAEEYREASNEFLRVENTGYVTNLYNELLDLANVCIKGAEMIRRKFPEVRRTKKKLTTNVPVHTSKA